MAEKKTRGHDRTRVWALVVYPESAPDNWRSILDNEHIEWVESPLHDMDVNESTGEVKKAHWHVVLAFDGPKSYDQVLELTKNLNCPIPQRCHSLRGAVRYMAHLDNPDKVQYSTTDIIPHGGFDLASALAPTSGQRYTLISEMLTWARENRVDELQDLIDYSIAERRDWFELLCDSCAYVVGQYLRSARHKRLAAFERDALLDPRPSAANEVRPEG